MSEYVIEMLNITKRFPGIVANDNITLQLKKGEIHALLGENGAGKSTLMSVLFGLYQPEEGEIRKDGKKVDIQDPNDANELGIGMVHQHFKLVECFSVLDNIMLGVETTTKGGFLKKDEVRKKVVELSEKYGLSVDPDAKIENITVGMQQRTEILKMLYRDNEVLIFDEPTAVLTPQEINELMVIMKNLAAEGKSILFITHKLAEIMAVADRCSVLRKGKYIDTVETAKATVESLTEMMVGEKVKLDINRTEPVGAEKRIEMRGITCRNKEGLKVLTEASFTAYSGEILGVAGISGSGQKELLESVAGLQPIESGEILYFSPEGTTEKISEMKAEDIKNLGITLSFVPEDRLGMGLVGSMDLTDNMMIRSYRNGKGPFLDRKGPRALAEKIKDQLEVMTPSISAPVRQMSGGNVQKVLVGREIAQNPKVLLVAFPTRGVDINTSHVIYQLLNEQKKKGVAVVCVIEDLDVVLELCDRIAVLCGGKISGVVDGRTATKEGIGLLMTKHEKGGVVNE